MLDFYPLSELSINKSPKEIIHDSIKCENYDSSCFISLSCKDNSQITTPALFPLPRYILNQIILLNENNISQYMFEIIHTQDTWHHDGYDFFVTLDEALEEFASVGALGSKLSSEGKLKHRYLMGNSHKFCRILPLDTPENYIDDNSDIPNATRNKIVSILPMHYEKELYNIKDRKILKTRQKISMDNIFISGKSILLKEFFENVDKLPLYKVLPFMDPNDPNYSFALDLLISAKLFSIEEYLKPENQGKTFAQILNVFLEEQIHSLSANMIQNMSFIGNSDRNRKN